MSRLKRLISEIKNVFASHRRKQEYLSIITEVTCTIRSYTEKTNHQIREQRGWQAEEMRGRSSALKQPRG